MPRKILLITIGLLLAALPSAASAKSHHRHKHHHHASSRAADSAGTVRSFAGGVLTIRRADGSMLTGDVTSATTMSCETEQEAEAQHAAETQHNRRGATAHAARNGGSGATGGGQSSDDTQPQVENETENEMESEPAQDTSSSTSSGCEASDMTAGAKVAKLTFAAGSHSMLAEVELVK